MSKEKLQEIKGKVNRCSELMDEIDSLKNLIADTIDIADYYCTFSQEWLRKVFNAGVKAEIARCQKELDELLRSLSPADSKPNGIDSTPWERIMRNIATENIVTADYVSGDASIPVKFPLINHKATN